MDNALNTLSATSILDPLFTRLVEELGGDPGLFWISAPIETIILLIMYIAAL